MEKTPNAEETSSQCPTKSPPPKPTEKQASVRSPPWASGPPNSTEEQAIVGSTSSEQPNSVEEQASARSTPPQILGLKASQIEPLKVGTLPESLPDTLDGGDPYQILYLIFDDTFFQTIANNTNFNADAKRHASENPFDCQRTWHPATKEEIKVFFGILIYMSITVEPSSESYWNRDLSEGAIHPVSTYMPLYRFQQLSRYLHISKADISPDLFRYGRPQKRAQFVKRARIAKRASEGGTDNPSQVAVYTFDELIQFLDGVIFHIWKSHSSQAKTKGKTQLSRTDIRRMLWRRLLSFSPYSPFVQPPPELKRKALHDEPAAHVPSKSLQLHTVRRHPMALKRNCIWCQEQHAIHKRLRNEMPPVPIPRTQWLCAECNVHLCKPGSGGNDCFKQFHKPLTAALDKDSALPVIYRTT
ncbi:hypothetical protein DPV78_002822 [Talaromyces pinophilus]|nr:hypothetical protein DPV78_002822 [Talaromyces pinophilus]